MTAPTLAGPRVTLRAFTDADAAARQRHGWHREIERGRKARLAIGLHAPELTGRGIGSEAIRVALRHAFGPLGMHRVDLKVLADNSRAIAAYRACGFVEEGRERESCFVEGSWHDDVVMGVLDREFVVADRLS